MKSKNFKKYLINFTSAIKASLIKLVNLFDNGFKEKYLKEKI